MSSSISIFNQVEYVELKLLCTVSSKYHCLGAKPAIYKAIDKLHYFLNRTVKKGKKA